MSAPTEFTIGSEVCSSDGPCGELRRVVTHPVAGAPTHLVVEPKHGRKKGRLAFLRRDAYSVAGPSTPKGVAGDEDGR